MTTRLAKFAVWFLLVGGAGGLALAQSGTPAPTPPAPAAGPPAGQPAAKPAPGRSDVAIPLRARANISVADMVKQTQEYITTMNEGLKRMVQLQELARRGQDVIKLNCVNDKLVQMKQLLNIADIANNNMQEAIARGDEDTRYHEFGRITIAADQAHALNTEAENCIGQDLTFLGPTTVLVEEPNIPEDPTLQQGPDFPVVQPLPVASPQS